MNLQTAAKRETLKHFGRAVQLYAPLYISNECLNTCAYCGFNRRSKIKRATLSFEQVLKEAQFLKRQGFQHLLLLSGEDPKEVPVEYLARITRALKETFVSVSIEVYPLSEEGYKTLIGA